MTEMPGGDMGAFGADMLVQQARQRLADGRRTPAVPQNVQKISLKKAAEVAQDFEAVFSAQMIGQMFKDVPIGKFGGGFGEKIWREHLYGEFGKTMAKGGPLGIAHQVLAQILQMQGKQPHEIRRLIDELLPRPESAAAPGRRAVTPSQDPIAVVSADGKTVLERNRGANATATAPVAVTPTMAGVETRRPGAPAAPAVRDSLYDKLPDGRETAVRPVGLPVPPDTARQAAGAPIPLFPPMPSFSNDGAPASSVGKAMLATFKAGNRAAAGSAGPAWNGSGHSGPTGHNIAIEPVSAAAADGPPVSLVAALAGQSDVVDRG